jgi:hypothetical protein
MIERLKEVINMRNNHFITDIDVDIVRAARKAIQHNKYYIETSDSILISYALTSLTDDDVRPSSSCSLTDRIKNIKDINDLGYVYEPSRDDPSILIITLWWLEGLLPEEYAYALELLHKDNILSERVYRLIMESIDGNINSEFSSAALNR